LQDADFVTTQIRVGSVDARIKDERIPLQYGIIGQETNGAGGLLKGLRTIPVLLEITQAMHTLCPDAWLINFTNPVGMVMEALFRYSPHQKLIGVCNLPIHMKKTIAHLLHVDIACLHIDFAGLNHLVYGLNVYVAGKNVTQQVIDLLCQPENEVMLQKMAPLPWQPDFLKSLGILLCPYHRYYYKTKEVLQQQLASFATGTTRAEKVKALEKELFTCYQNPQLDVKPPQLEQRGGAYYSDAACNLIDSIYNNKGDIQTVNVQNQGAIANIADESTVEVNCVVTTAGAHPLKVGELPVEVNGLVQQIKSFERVAAEAAVTGSYEKALLAMTIHPLVPSDHIAKQVLDDLLQAHRQYLPHFFKGGDPYGSGT
jgi:6-phospho-beta-glucosidase